MTIAVDDDWVAHAMDHTSGRARWSRRIEPPFGMELDDVIVPFGAHEVVLGAELVDLRTGLGDPAVRWPFVIAGEEIVWDEGAAVMRRPPGAPARAALEVPSMLSLDAFSAAEALVVVASRATAWAPEVARRDVPERVSLDQLTPRDSTVIVALGSHDEVRWVVATHGALRGGCDLPALGMVGVELSRVAGDRFERSAFAIHRATGAVLSVDGPHVCSAEMPPSPSR